MAIFFLKVKTIRRAAGRSATAAAAYRAGALIADQRSGQVFDYRRRGGVLVTGLVGWDGSREALWNAAEVAEKRRDAVVGREVLVALPHELPRKAQIELLGEFTHWLRAEHRVAVDWCLHLPDSDGDARNVHGHILITARRVEAGRFAEKTLEFDRRPASRQSIEAVRHAWGQLTNKTLARYRQTERIDNRSYRRRGADLGKPQGAPLLAPAGLLARSNLSRNQKAAMAALVSSARALDQVMFYEEDAATVRQGPERT